MITAKVVAHSINSFNNEIISFLITFPRMILAEFNTHRRFSRNSASSRAIPFKKMVQSVIDNPFVPLVWQETHTGMQGSKYIKDPDKIQELTMEWLQARDYAVKQATNLDKLGVTKQICNRLLEPFMWHTVAFTTTELENFFGQRSSIYINDLSNKSHRSINEYLHYNYHPEKQNEKKYILPGALVDWMELNQGKAEPHMMLLCEAIFDAYNQSEPDVVFMNDWHIPFRNDILNQFNGISIKEAIKVSSSMMARTSYTVFDEVKEVTFEKHLKLHDDLIPDKHWSPLEHPARASQYIQDSRNFTGGWEQYRHLIERGICY